MIRALAGDQEPNEWNRIGLATFSDSSRILFHLKDYKVSFHDYLKVRMGRVEQYYYYFVL